MDFRLLGALEVVDDDGRELAIGSGRQRALLALLLLRGNELVSSEVLVEQLWGEAPPPTAQKMVHNQVAALRRALGGERLETRGGGYRLRLSEGERDVDRFEALVGRGRESLDQDPEAAAEAFSEALSLWRGPALADLAYESFAQTEVGRLEERRLVAFEGRVEAELALGRHADVVGELEAAVAEQPLRERLHGQLMLALYRCGRQADALEAYRRARQLLVEQLGLEPSPELRQLHQAILTHGPELEAPERARRRPTPPSTTLPRALLSPADAPFVAREPELARLRELWAAASAGSRVAAIVAGEAGIGKTRLAAEVARLVDRMGGLVLYGRCDQDLAVPYQPFVEALRPVVRAMGPDRLKADLGGLAAELPRLLPELGALGEPTRADPETERFAMFEAVSALGEAVTGGRPTLFVLDDLHWAAAPTLLMLRHLIRSERPQRALFLGTYRDTELDIDHPLARLLADLERDARAEKLNIAGLDEAGIASLLEAAAGQAAGGRTAELAHLLQIETGGNPFFVRELLAHLIESGAIDSRGEQGTDLVPSLLEVPEGLRHVIRQRVARQSETSQRTLSVAAVAGPSFSLTILERVLEGESGVLDALDEAAAAGLLTETGPGHYAFAHALVRQAIYAGLSSARRMRMHRRVGEALEALADRESRIEALAHHFSEAAADGQAHKAAAYALAAGRSATARLAYEDATAHYGRGLQALALAPQSDDRQRCELLLALGEARWRTEDLADAREACIQAGVLAERLGLTTVQARAALGVAGPVRLEVPTAATQPVVAVLEKALAALPEEESALRARLMARLAAVVAFSRPEQRRPALAREALDIARRAGDKAALAEVLDASTWAMTGPDNVDERMGMLRELARFATELGDISLRASAHEAMHDLLLAQGDVEGSERELEAREQLPQAQRRRSPRWWAALARARRAYLDGRLDHCEELAHEALRLGLNELEAAQAFQAQMFAVRREQGRLEELVDAVQRTLAERPEFAGWRAALAYTYAELDRPADARRELETLAQRAFSDLPRDGFWAMNLSLLSHVVAVLDDVPRAKLFYELLLPFGGRCVVAFTTVCLGSASRPLGLLAATMSRYEQAARHFEDALEMNARIRSPLWIAHTQHEYARMLLRDRRGDRQKALALLGDALGAAEELGLRALADRGTALRERAHESASV